MPAQPSSPTAARHFLTLFSVTPVTLYV